MITKPSLANPAWCKYVYCSNGVFSIKFYQGMITAGGSNQLTVKGV